MTSLKDTNKEQRIRKKIYWLRHDKLSPLNRFIVLEDELGALGFR